MNAKTFEMDDPILTAYALGETEAFDADALADFAAALEADPELRADVEAIRALAVDLAAELDRQPVQDDVAESIDKLDPVRRQVVLKAGTLAARPVEKMAVAPPTWVTTALAIAAVMVFFVFFTPAFRHMVAIYDGVYVWMEQAKTSTGHADAARTKADGPEHGPLVRGLLRLGGATEPEPHNRSEKSSLLAESGPTAPAPMAGAVGERIMPGATVDQIMGLSAPRLAAITPVAAPITGGPDAAEYSRSPNTPGLPLDLNLTVTSLWRQINGTPSADDLRAVLPTEPAPPRDPIFNTETYQPITDNPFLSSAEEPLSTFSIDVDTASFSNVRRYVEQMGSLPPPDAVRIEELVNYFPYDYEPPSQGAEEPFAVQVDLGAAPWAPDHRLVKIGIKGREVARAARPEVNLVFLIDVSGSMQDANKLPLVKESLGMLVEELGDRDRVAIVVYAGSSGLVLPSTRGSERRDILRAIENLEAGGSTNGGEGIQLAYDVARQNFIEGGANRVMLLTDGDFNVGVTDQGSLLRLITEEADDDVFLSVLGFGMGNYKDGTLEMLADKGNGNYGYVDGIKEARKLLVEGLSGTLVTIAKDVKIQVEFNPARVAYYRQIGYENRVLAAEDFNDDTKDAGEIGAGHTITALYEVVPVGVELNVPGVDPLRYRQPADLAPGALDSPELMWVKLRYKAPEGDVSRLIERPVEDRGDAMRGSTSAAEDFRFAAAVAAYGMLLRNSPYKGEADFGLVDELARSGRGSDVEGYRADFLEVVEATERLAPRR